MKIIINGGKSGWVEYVLNGTKQKPRAKEKIEIIDGDLNLTKKIYESDKVKERYTRIVLSFKGKEELAKIKQVYEDFKREFLKGYEEEEYNISAVLHRDTENDHVHICLPKLNLKTKNHNNYYYDKIDRYRINLIRDYLNIKYDLKTEKGKELIKEDKTISRLEKWREEHKQPRISLKRKRARDKATKDIKDYLTELINSDLVNTLEETEKIIETLDLKIVKKGWDKIAGEKEYYITIQDKYNNKLKLKGEYFNEKFYQFRNKDKETERAIKQGDKGSRERNDRKFTEIKQKLEEANYKRIRRIKARYRNIKKRSGRENNINNSKDSVNSIDRNKLRNRNNDNRKRIHDDNTGKTNKINISNNKNDTRELKDGNINTRDQEMERGSENITRERETRIRKLFNAGRTRIQNIKRKIQGIGKRIRGGIMYVKKETERIKQELSIVDLAINNGFKIIENKSSKNSKVMDNGINKIIVSKNIKNKHYIFFNTEDGSGGSVIDFYKKYINDKKGFIEILKDLQNFLKYGEINYKLEGTQIEEMELKKEIIRLKPLKEANVFLKSKGIEDNTVKAFYPYILKDYRNNTDFILQNFTREGEKLKIEEIGIDKRNKDYKNISGEKGLWGKKIGKEANDFYIFESPIDAISFYQLYQKSGNYISIGGNISKKEIESLKSLNKHIRPHIINICTDKDKGGNLLAVKLKDIFSLSSVNLKRQEPIRNDFNEDLLYKKKKEKEERERKKREEEKYIIPGPGEEITRRRKRR